MKRMSLSALTVFLQLPRRAVALALAATACLGVQASLKPLEPRHVLSLDGAWQVEQGGLDTPPTAFTHQVVVPGLIDMAQPAFAEAGRPSAQRQAFWYRRTFTLDGGVPEVALLKIHKARYGTKVFLNGTPVGEHLPCFTPAYLPVREALKGDGQENVLLIRVGADRSVLPAGQPGGWDFEKYLYLPGIYDSVELIQTRLPYVRNVQIVPDPARKSARVVAELVGLGNLERPELRATIREVASGRTVLERTLPLAAVGNEKDGRVDFTLPVADGHLWTPEDPFLYELQLNTGSDGVRVRFGLRSFRFDPQTGRAMLNGKPYYLRGSNVTIYRFFEDAARGDRPWRAEWVRRLHEKFKGMHWNSLRYCIGFPPELWYDIADETGFLIQDEFPIWLLGEAPEKPVTEKIIPEYTEWMRERWNHACVVIWDAQNESFTDQTGAALRAVRGLDLSNRPWENGWGEPQSPTDCVESHPYFFIRDWQSTNRFHLSELESMSGVPALQEAQRKLKVPIIINEYGWLWLNRDGTPTCLTEKVYQNLLGPNATADQRRRLYARYLAAKTEFWRAHRACAGVLHFCGLGYSRPGDKPRPEGGATSDHWMDLERLTFEPYFEQYVKDAFNPLGVMLDFWREELPGETEQTFRVSVVNDRNQDWEGDVRLLLTQNGRHVTASSQAAYVPALGQGTFKLKLTLPDSAGPCTLSAELLDIDGKTIRSLRDFKVTRSR